MSISGRMVFIRLWCISRRCCCHFSSKILELLGIALRYIYMTGFGLCFKGPTLDLGGRMREMRSNQGACHCCAGAKRSRNKRVCSRVELKRGGGMCAAKARRSTSFAVSWRRRPRRQRGEARERQPTANHHRKVLQPINRSLVLFVMYRFITVSGGGPLHDKLQA